MATAQQFICKKCDSLVTVEQIEKTADELHFARCPNCSSRNQLVVAGATLSQPGLLPVKSLLE
jgi:Zn finger protein HypA/HybF involved in hydrogenase expression